MKKSSTQMRPHNEKERFRVELARLRGFDWFVQPDGCAQNINTTHKKLPADEITVFCPATKAPTMRAILPPASTGATPIARANQRADADGLSHEDNDEQLKKLEGWRAYALCMLFSTQVIRDFIEDDSELDWRKYPQVFEYLGRPLDASTFDMVASLAKGMAVQRLFDHFDVPNALISETLGLVRDLEPVEIAQDKGWAQHFDAVMSSIVKIERTLLQGNIRLVWEYAHSAPKKMGLAAALRAGLDGLDHAITRFETRRGNHLSTYAIHWIQQRIRRTSVNHLAVLRLPVHRDNARRKLWAITYQMWARERRAPQLDELAGGLEISTERLRQLLSLIRRPRLSTCAGQRGILRLDRLEMPEHPSPRERFDGHAAPGPTTRITRRLTELTDYRNLRAREIVWRRLGLGIQTAPTLQQLGDEYNVTRERIRQIQSKNLDEICKKWPQRTLEDELRLYRDEADDA